MVNAVVGVSSARGEALVAAGQPIPSFLPVRALVDTGASCTCIDPSILKALDLTPTGSVTVNTPTTGQSPQVAEQYDISLVIPGNSPQHSPLARMAIPVVAAELSKQGIQALIGRDVLSECVFHYNGDIGWFTVAY